MNHLSWDDIWDYLDGELADSTTAKQHIGTCADCARKLQHVRTANSAIVDSFHMPEVNSEGGLSSDGLIQRLQTMDAQPGSRRRRSRINWGVWTAGVSGAAAAIVIGTIVGIRAFSPTESVSNGLVKSGTATVQPKHDAVANATDQQSNVLHGLSSAAGTTGSTGTSNGPAIMNKMSLRVPDIQSSLEVQVNAAGTGSSSSQPLAGAQVSVLANGNLVTDQVTGQDGATQKVGLHVPVDPVLSPSFQVPGATPRGSATVVVSKSGYQPAVLYDTWIFSGQPTTLSFTLKRNGEQVPSIEDNWFHLLEIGQYAQWAAQQIKSGAQVQSPQPGVPVGHVQVTVVDQAGRAVSNAKVVVVAGDVITAIGTTSATGSTTPLPSTGMRDLRAAYPGQNLSELPNTVNLVVLKDGYATAVDFYQPFTIGQTIKVAAKLESLAWRQSNHSNNLDAPTYFSGSGQPSRQATQTLIQWVTKHKRQ